MSPLFFSIDFSVFLNNIRNFVWGEILIILLLSVGIIYTFKTGFIQIFQLKNALKNTFKTDRSAKGDISPFASLCTTLSATVGTGNIVGVATAVSLGGPGALFWMIVSAFFGMATKYAEGFLAIKYRKADKNGEFSGGPFYYIEHGLGKKFKPLAVLFSVFGTLTGILGIGTLTQSNSIISALSTIPDFTKYKLLVSLLLTAVSCILIFGGIKKISLFSSVTVPIMALIYIISCIVILIRFKSNIPNSLELILSTAFIPKSAIGAISGLTIKSVIQTGIGRGMFSNEAGLGSSPISAAVSKNDNPVEQGLVCMLSAFIDTVIICSLTGLVIIVTNAYSVTSLLGLETVKYAWKKGLPLSKNTSEFLIIFCLVLFAFTTIIGWNFYSERCLKYLFKKEKSQKIALLLFRVSYVSAVFGGCYISVENVWTIADIFNGLMAFPNLIALFLLSKKVTNETRFYVKIQNLQKNKST